MLASGSLPAVAWLKDGQPSRVQARLDGTLFFGGDKAVVCRSCEMLC